ncbi:MAG: hypothetical protein JHD16_09100 [Solirubrobacteraceae bacterium]|nr:hypothetical protein [Solirubrobacteraceae bacterium]
MLASAVATALGEISWPEVAWLWDEGGADARFEVGGCIREFSVLADWDEDPWQSSTFSSVFVSGVARGQSRRWTHSTTARCSDKTLPASPPAAVPFDFEALVRRAVVQHA